MPAKGGLHMNKNQTDIERFVRIVIGGALLLAGTYLSLGTLLSWVAIILGLILMLTGLAGYCPCYALLGINRNK
jgi:hypothetical protein